MHDDIDIILEMKFLWKQELVFIILEQFKSRDYILLI